MPLKGRLRRTRSCTQAANVPPSKASGSASAIKAKGTPGRPTLRGRASTSTPIGNKVTPKATSAASASASTGRRTRGRAAASKVEDKKGEAETSEEFDDEEDDEQVDEGDEIEEDDDDITEDNKASPSKNDDSTGKNSRALRRRDKIKTTDRYSPELHEPSRRTRGKGGSLSFPSTAASSSKYITFDSDDEMNSNGGGVKRRKVDISTAKKEVQTFIVDVKKDEESNKMLIMLPDGTTYKVDPTPGIYGASKRTPGKATGRPRPSDEELDEDYEDDGAIVDDTDEDFKPRQTPRRKKATPKGVKTETSSSFGAASRFTRKPVLATGIKVTGPGGRVRPPGESTPAPTKLIITPKVLSSSDGSKTTKITSPSTTGKTKVTFITTPKSVTLTATSTSFKQPPKRNYGSSAKFIDELPELSECTTDDNDSSLSKLPDRILFINSDLPLQHSLASENENKLYLFHQVMSPIMTTYPCLLCPGTKFAYKEEKDLIVHYSSYHELTIEHTTAKFSEDIVFVCLPKSIITQLEESENGSTIILNAPCQYCGEQIKLETVDDMRNHYADVHSKEIKLIEQEEIMSMHKALYCCLCEVQSPDFASHHNHMKTEHHMHTYVCKCCVFTTQDSSRLKTHFRAKHMISNNRIQNLQCTYCSGLIYGIERMNKHIMVTHCVQTGANEFSCTACLQPCGKADELLAHSYRCPSLTMGTTPKEIEETDVKIEAKDGQKVSTKCFLCDKVFESAELCDLHLNHVHTKWAVRNVIHDTFLMVKHPNGKTDLMPSTSGAEVPPLKLNDLPPMKLFDEVGTKKNYGHYCFKCESIIKIYPLYYLHMFNVHKMGKVFECKISSCRKTFKEAKGLEEHMRTTKHPQKSVIEDPLGAIACHFCNLYFADDKELQKHLLSEDHFNKINQLMDKSGNKPEPRNHKCKTCHTWFGLADSYIYHLETESHKHGCSYCGLHFALPSSRRTHIQSHHSEKSDICEICNVKQGSKERLFAHLVEHNIVFECNRCMRKFYQREQLNAHMETHGDSRDCPWEGCQRKINRSSLTTHIRQHRIENESKCNICGKGFSSRQVLQTHMEIHAKAESNAKAILQAVPSMNQHKSSSSHQPLSGSVSSTTTPGTTLISITTPPSSLTSIKQRPSPIKSRGRSQQGKTVFTSSRSSNGIPSGLRIMCCSCNQAFNSHNELSNHKCVVPVVTITGTKPNSNEIQLDQNAVNNLMSSPIVISQSNKFQLPVNSTLITTTTSNTTASTKDETMSDNLEEDPQKLVLDIAEQLSQAVQEEEAEKLKQKQLKKVEQLLQQQSHTQHKQTDLKKPVVGPVPTGGNMQSRTKRTYSSIKTASQGNDVAERQVTTNSGSENQIEEIKRSSRKEVVREQPRDTIVYSNDDQSGVKEEVAKIDSEENNMIEMPIFDGENANPGDQYIMLQQSDGQCYQICVPEGMDMEEVVRSLNITFSENPDGTSELMTTTEGTTATTADPLEQSMQEVTDQIAGTTTSMVEGMDDQQIIYLPVNEDGTCAIDPAALAMLTGSGEIPIIVTSSN